MEPFKLRYRENVAVKTRNYHRIAVGSDGYIIVNLDSVGVPRLVSTHTTTKQPLNMTLAAAAIDDWMERRREDAAVKSGIQAAVERARRTGVVPTQGCAGAYMDKAKRSLVDQVREKAVPDCDLNLSDDQWRMLNDGIWDDLAATSTMLGPIGTPSGESAKVFDPTQPIWIGTTEGMIKVTMPTPQEEADFDRNMRRLDETGGHAPTIPEFPQAKLDSAIRNGQMRTGQVCPHCGDGPGNAWIGWTRNHGNEPATCWACEGKFWPVERSFKDAAPKPIPALPFAVGDQVMLRLSLAEEQRCVIRCYEIRTRSWCVDVVASDGTILRPWSFNDDPGVLILPARKVDPIPLKEPGEPRLLERGPKVYCQGEELP